MQPGIKCSNRRDAQLPPTPGQMPPLQDWPLPGREIKEKWLYSRSTPIFKVNESADKQESQPEFRELSATLDPKLVEAQDEQFQLDRTGGQESNR